MALRVTASDGVKVQQWQGRLSAHVKPCMRLFPTADPCLQLQQLCIPFGRACEGTVTQTKALAAGVHGCGWQERAVLAVGQEEEGAAQGRGVSPQVRRLRLGHVPCGGGGVLAAGRSGATAAQAAGGRAGSGQGDAAQWQWRAANSGSA